MTPDTLSQLRSGRLAGVRRLDLSHAGLTEFPQEIFDLRDSLEILDLSGNQLDRLPADLQRLHRLQTLFCSSNRFDELPVSLGACQRLDIVGFKANRIRRVDAAALPPSLRWLILTDNHIESLPGELGGRPRLQKLMLAGNRLQALPDSLAACNELALLRIAANQFESLPAWLPRLPRLAWLAYGGNPLTEAREQALAQGAPHEVGWHEITLGGTLGEGASGVIHSAHVGQGSGSRPVAVKIFKGAVTSDGLPASEMAASLAAGTHPALLGAEARLAGHPQGRAGMLMRLVGPGWRILAGPPSLQSCTRDVYPPGSRFEPDFALRLASDVASAMAHLHRRAVLHGDLYAHNILVDRQGHALLGDFGAASLADPGHSAQAGELQQLEVRAFGCLLEELRQHGNGEAYGDGAATLQALETACLQETPADRPRFDDIADALRTHRGGD